MRIIHVVSGLAPDQRFGGISRVALDLAREQSRSGHRVHVVSTDIGFPRQRPRSVDGVRVTLLRSLHLAPALGFGTIVSPGLPIAMARLLRDADLVHVHLAREFNTLGAALIAQIAMRPVVLQTHGMLDEPSNRLAVVVDLMLTSPVLRRATCALTLTEAEDREVARLSRGRLQPTRFPNGIDLSPASTAPSVAKRTSVLFLSRLHPRKGAVRFVEASADIARKRTDLTFDVVGPDEGDAEPVRAMIARVRAENIRHLGAVEHREVASLMAAALLYCLPARGEPFGLTVLEAMAAGTPVLLHDSAELAEEIVAHHAGWTFSGSADADDLDVVLARALGDPDELSRRGVQARRLVERRYGITSIVQRLDVVYRSVMGTTGSGLSSAVQRAVQGDETPE